jgi:hypothetical protein
MLERNTIPGIVISLSSAKEIMFAGEGGGEEEIKSS